MPAATGSARQSTTTMLSLTVACLLLSGFASHSFGYPATSVPLDFKERVAAQRAIEEVYWNRRTWPQQNPGPKPAFDDVFPEARISAIVEDYLRTSDALQQLWNRPLASAQLQREMERIASQTCAPDTLDEILDALGHDPNLVVETLVRPLLADRLIRSWYARDERFHAPIRRLAEDTLSSQPGPGDAPSLVPEYDEVTWRLGGDTGTKELTDPAIRDLDDLSWQHQVRTLANLFDPGATGERETAVVGPAAETSDALGQLPLLVWSPLQERDDGFISTMILDHGAGFVRIATARWPKLSFDSWWSDTREAMNLDLPAVDGKYWMPSLDNASCTLDAWQETNIESPPDARNSHTTIWTGTEMIVWGGFVDSYPSVKTGGRYDPALDAWRGMSTSVSGRDKHVAVWTGTEMIVWGGIAQSAPHAEGARYDPVSDSWESIPVQAGTPEATYKAIAVWTGTEMIVWGGKSSSRNEAANTGGRYDPITGLWSPTAGGAEVPAARSGHTGVWTGAEMIVWGGNSATPGVLSTGGRYDPKRDRWQSTSTVWPPSGRVGHTAVWTGTEMIVWGGGGGGFKDTGGRYDPKSDVWTATSVTADTPESRTNQTAVWTGTEMIVWGGHKAYLEKLRTGGRYDPVTDSWTPTSMGANVPTARQSHSAVWTGTEMIVWGGDTVSGGRYDPTTDTWLPTTLGSHMPVARRDHTAIWTGAEMIVWGGDDGSTRLQSGGRYDPATNSWRETSTGSNIPSPRTSHTALWSGTEMIVWGGNPWSQSGGRYDPVSDTWLPTSIGSGVPAGRVNHTAVWTGSEMIVWGGLSGMATVNTGGRYDPTLDTWIPTSLAPDVPAPRRFHSAVWNGDRMIVWGGIDRATKFQSGSLYDPATDSWIAMSTGSGIPSPRSYHTALWTGVEMLVWGGNPQLPGLRYDPGTDSWRTMQEVGASELAGDSAIWTGEEMIVWGGSSVVGSDSSVGARYNPTTDSWFAISSGGPDLRNRANYSMVWTGTEMIVWGGSLSEPSGGRYCACGDWYLDDDGDRAGTAGNVLTSCSRPAGHAPNGGDCDDSDPLVHPGAEEICNAIDDNCNLLVDDDELGQDTDSDGVHNTCDNCREVENSDQLDVDDDSVGDTCDNCILEPNPGQSDMDLDDRGDACDNCVTEANYDQGDYDGDSYGDACDNCFVDRNPSQADMDSDHQGDICDLDDGMIYISFRHPERVEWQEESGFESWNSYRGDLDLLKGAGLYTQDPALVPLANRSCDLTVPWEADSDPPAGAGIFFLTTGNFTGTGVESELGMNSSGIERVNEEPCP